MKPEPQEISDEDAASRWITVPEAPHQFRQPRRMTEVENAQ